MELLSGAKLSRYLLEKYSKNPRGWNFTVSPASGDNNFFDALVSGPDETWKLKIDSIFKPSPIVLGTKVDVNEIDRKKLFPSLPTFPSYGYRRLDLDVVLRLLHGASATQEERDGDPKYVTEIERILADLEPIAPTGGHSYAQGPFVFTKQRLSGLSQTQADLDEKLTFEIKNLLRERFPSYG
jgi:hypothetical protein